MVTFGLYPFMVGAGGKPPSADSCNRVKVLSGDNTCWLCLEPAYHTKVKPLLLRNLYPSLSSGISSPKIEARRGTALQYSPPPSPPSPKVFSTDDYYKMSKDFFG